MDPSVMVICAGRWSFVRVRARVFVCGAEGGGGPMKCGCSANGQRRSSAENGQSEIEQQDSLWQQMPG